MRIKEFNDRNTEILMRGYIDDEPQRLSDKQKLILKVKEINVPGSNFVYFLEGRVLITTPSANVAVGVTYSGNNPLTFTKTVDGNTYVKTLTYTGNNITTVGPWVLQ